MNFTSVSEELDLFKDGNYINLLDALTNKKINDLTVELGATKKQIIEKKIDLRPINQIITSVKNLNNQIKQKQTSDTKETPHEVLNFIFKYETACLIYKEGKYSKIQNSFPMASSTGISELVNLYRSERSMKRKTARYRSSTIKTSGGADDKQHELPVCSNLWYAEDYVYVIDPKTNKIIHVDPEKKSIQGCMYRNNPDKPREITDINLFYTETIPENELTNSIDDFADTLDKCGHNEELFGNYHSTYANLITEGYNDKDAHNKAIKVIGCENIQPIRLDNENIINNRKLVVIMKDKYNNLTDKYGIKQEDVHKLMKIVLDYKFGVNSLITNGDTAYIG